jgi:hypothetical protein
MSGAAEQRAEPGSGGNEQNIVEVRREEQRCTVLRRAAQKRAVENKQKYRCVEVRRGAMRCDEQSCTAKKRGARRLMSEL